MVALRTCMVLAALVVTAAATAQTMPSLQVEHSVGGLISHNANLTTLSALITQAGLASTLSSNANNFTVFAPTDAAFAKVPDYKVKLLTASQNADTLTAVLEYHVASGNLPSSSFAADEKIKTLQGSHVFIEFITGTTTLGMASATCDNNVHFMGEQLEATNGLVHVIDTVLMPPAVLCPDEVFFVEQRGQGRVAFNGYDCRAKGEEKLSSDEVKPVGLAVDSNTQQVFWSNDENAKPNDSWLTSTTFNAQNLTKFVQNMYDPQGMDTDTKSRKLYFTQHQGNKVNRVNYDGTDLETLWVGRYNQDFPADVAVDSDAGVVFSTVQSVPTIINGSIHMHNMNGTGYTTVATGLNKNYGLCVDDYAKHLYYIQGGNGGSISCHAYGATPCNTTDGKDGIILGQLQYPYMCVVDNLYAPYGGPTRVIWSEPNVPGTIYSAYNDGSHLQTIASNLDAPMGVKLGCKAYFG